MQDRAAVAEPLRQGEAAPEERIVAAEDLRHPARPADALSDVGGEGLRLQPRRLRDAEIGRTPAAAMQAKRGVRVLGDGFGGDPADLGEGAAPEHRARAAEEGRVPGVEPALDDAVEQLALRRNRGSGAQVPAVRIRRVEMVRGLDERETRVAHEPAHRYL